MFLISNIYPVIVYLKCRLFIATRKFNDGVFMPETYRSLSEMFSVFNSQILLTSSPGFLLIFISELEFDAVSKALKI